MNLFQSRFFQFKLDFVLLPIHVINLCHFHSHVLNTCSNTGKIFHRTPRWFGAPILTLRPFVYKGERAAKRALDEHVQTRFFQFKLDFVLLPINVINLCHFHSHVLNTCSNKGIWIHRAPRWFGAPILHCAALSTRASVPAK